MLKSGVNVMSRRDLNFIIGKDGKPVRFKPWLVDAFAFLYDSIMEKSIFPKKLAADIAEHRDTLSRELSSVHRKRVLELATGTGSVTSFLGHDNSYVGIDISPGLLRRAAKRLRLAGFKDYELYVSRADDLPFQDESFDLCICILSLNFFGDQAQALKEAHRVLAPDSTFLCAVPAPERSPSGSTIRGTLYSEKELRDLVHEKGFTYESIPCDNGALLYFRAIKG